MCPPYTGLLGALDDLDQPPVLILGNGACLHNQHLIADIALVLLVVRLELNGVLDDLFIQRMLFAAFDRDDDRLVHFIGNDLADSGFSERSIRIHLNLLLSLTPCR